MIRNRTKSRKSDKRTLKINGIKLKSINDIVYNVVLAFSKTDFKFNLVLTVFIIISSFCLMSCLDVYLTLSRLRGCY